MLDPGCGTGAPIGAELKRREFAVTGVDSSASGIHHARAMLPDGTWLVDDMRHLSSSDRFNRISAWHSFFHLSLDDQRAMILPFAQLVRGGGAGHVNVRLPSR